MIVFESKGTNDVESTMRRVLGFVWNHAKRSMFAAASTATLEYLDYGIVVR
eukprot:m.54299 g.54299  ORF g.54299 m.54299 type:complete len:51 (+) comp11407_c0_seq2:4095-4247(+)